MTNLYYLSLSYLNFPLIIEPHLQNVFSKMDTVFLLQSHELLQKRRQYNSVSSSLRVSCYSRNLCSDTTIKLVKPLI